MRQAGRYLPEYREIRLKKENFLDLCYNPKLAAKITLQPIDRFNLDGAILFSDILVIPDALGIKTEFIKNHGPKLQPITEKKELDSLDFNNIENYLNPVFETIDIVKSKKPKETLIKIHSYTRNDLGVDRLVGFFDKVCGSGADQQWLSPWQLLNLGCLKCQVFVPVYYSRKF